MNEHQVSELFIAQEQAEEPPLPPGYLESVRAAGIRGARRRRLRTTVVGGVAVVAALALTGTATASYLGGRPATTGISAAEQGYGDYDPLVQRLAPGWLPDGANSYSMSGGAGRQGMSVSQVTGTPKRLGVLWDIQIYLFAPGVGPMYDGPLEHARFGHGRPVDPVQGLPTERLGDSNGYTLSWKYPSGAHAAVTVGQVRGERPDESDTVGVPAGTGFGDRVVEVARRVADHLRIDGHTPLRFPFAMPPIAGQRLYDASTSWFRQPGQKLVTTARLTFVSSAAPRDPRKGFSTVEVDSRVNEGDPTGTGKPSSGEGGRIYLVPHTHGFFLTVRLTSGNAEDVADRVRIFGDPEDQGTWRANPVRD